MFPQNSLYLKSNFFKCSFGCLIPLNHACTKLVEIELIKCMVCNKTYSFRCISFAAYIFIANDPAVFCKFFSCHKKLKVPKAGCVEEGRSDETLLSNAAGQSLCAAVSLGTLVAA